jgi:hypothetical protein
MRQSCILIALTFPPTIANDAHKTLLSIKFKQSKYDNLFYFRREDRIYIITHVNDFKVIGPTRTVVNKVKQQLMGKFDIVVE